MVPFSQTSIPKSQKQKEKRKKLSDQFIQLYSLGGLQQNTLNGLGGKDINIVLYMLSLSFWGMNLWWLHYF